MNWVSKLKPEKFGKLLDFGFLVNATTAQSTIPVVFLKGVC